MGGTEANGETQLYRHFADDGVLLYVGVSLSTIARLRSHQKSAWFNRIAKITIERFPNRKVALKAERRAIRKEAPVYNVVGRKKPRITFAQIRRAADRMCEWHQQQRATNVAH